MQRGKYSAENLVSFSNWHERCSDVEVLSLNITFMELQNEYHALVVGALWRVLDGTNGSVHKFAEGLATMFLWVTVFKLEVIISVNYIKFILQIVIMEGSDKKANMMRLESHRLG